MEDQEQTPPTQIEETPAAPIEEAVEEAEGEVEPTKSVDNFWERLDKVFTQNTEMRDKMNELLEQFPETAEVGRTFRSAIFQPTRISLSSKDDITLNTTQIDLSGDGPQIGAFWPANNFYQFRVRFLRPLIKVKNIQLLSAVIPTPNTSIPNPQCTFIYYRLPQLQGVAVPWATGTTFNPFDVVAYAPNGRYYFCKQTNQNLPPNSVPAAAAYWTDLGNDGTYPFLFGLLIRPLNPFIQTINLSRTDILLPEQLNSTLGMNRIFQDYQDLVDSLNYAAANSTGPQVNGKPRIGASEPGDVKFALDERLNRIIFLPQDTANWYYMPCGYEDLNALGEQIALKLFSKDEAYAPQQLGYFLNQRLGYTWNGRFANFLDPNKDPMYQGNPLLSQLFYFVRPQLPLVDVANDYIREDELTFNSYPDLVYSGSVGVYADVVLGSTQTSDAETTPVTTNSALLSTVPVNAQQLQIAMYQNNFNNPLKNVPEIIPEIGITLLTDTGLPYWLPNNCLVNLELAVEYF